MLRLTLILFLCVTLTVVTSARGHSEVTVLEQLVQSQAAPPPQGNPGNPAGPGVPGLPQPQPQPRQCQCEEDKGDSCGPRNPCCQGLVCRQGKCMEDCPPIGSLCQYGQPDQPQCCMGDSCVAVGKAGTQQVLAVCGKCKKIFDKCNPAILQGFFGGCCPGNMCYDFGTLGHYCIPDISNNNAGRK